MAHQSEESGESFPRWNWQTVVEHHRNQYNLPFINVMFESIPELFYVKVEHLEGQGYKATAELADNQGKRWAYQGAIRQGNELIAPQAATFDLAHALDPSGRLAKLVEDTAKTYYGNKEKHAREQASAAGPSAPKPKSSSSKGSKKPGKVTKPTSQGTRRSGRHKSSDSK